MTDAERKQQQLAEAIKAMDALQKCIAAIDALAPEMRPSVVISLSVRYLGVGTVPVAPGYPPQPFPQPPTWPEPAVPPFVAYAAPFAPPGIAPVYAAPVPDYLPWTAPMQGGLYAAPPPPPPAGQGWPFPGRGGLGVVLPPHVVPGSFVPSEPNPTAPSDLGTRPPAIPPDWGAPPRKRPKKGTRR